MSQHSMYLKMKFLHAMDSLHFWKVSIHFICTIDRSSMLHLHLYTYIHGSPINYTDEECQKLIESMPRRVQVVIIAVFIILWKVGFVFYVCLVAKQGPQESL